MGIAIVYVIFYHFFGITLVPQMANGFFSFGYLGVDVFMFCSGFGLACSYLKRFGTQSEILQFYIKRLKRILPAYYIAVLLHIFVIGLSAVDAIWNLTIFSFYFLKPFFDWYIPSALILYLFFPYYCKTVNKRGIVLATVIPIIIGVSLTLVLVYIGKGSHIMFFGRIPIFFIGSLYGYFLNQKRNGEDNSRTVYFVSIVFALCAVLATILQYFYFTHYDMLFLHRHALLYLPFALIVPSFCILFTYVMSYMEKCEFLGTSIIWLLGFIGSLSLELYLLHVAFPTHGVHFIFLTYLFAYPLKYGSAILLNSIIKYTNHK